MAKMVQFETKFVLYCLRHPDPQYSETIIVRAKGFCPEDVSKKMGIKAKREAEACWFGIPKLPKHRCPVCKGYRLVKQ